MELFSCFLLLFSLLFYAFGGAAWLLLLLLESAVAYGAGLLLAKGTHKRLLLTLAVIFFLAVLGFFKYADFGISILNTLFAPQGTEGLPLLRMALPLGISFTTFKLISYVADVRAGRVRAEKSFRQFLLYACCFHHVLQGPIVRYADVRSELYIRSLDLASFSNGSFRFCLGLAKKTLLADHLGEIVSVFLPVSESIRNVSAAGLWLGSICFTMQIYLDFSAYSDMALGLGEMIGFHYKENFNYPYAAVSVRDFWRRWHISLSSFFRDYVYIPMGGSRQGLARTIVNLLAVWLLTGLWHGANWNFILWGLYYFVFLTIENLLRALRSGKGYEIDPDLTEDELAASAGRTLRDRLASIPARVYTLLVVNTGWILFRFEDLHALAAALKGLFGFGGVPLYSATVGLTVMNNLFLLLIALAASSPFFLLASRSLQIGLQEYKISKRAMYAVQTISTLLLFALALFSMAGNTYTPFLYNNF